MNDMNEEFGFHRTRVEVISAPDNSGRLFDLTVTASHCEIHPDLIRHYCRIGLVQPAARDEAKNPYFDDDAIYWIRQIRELNREGEVGQRALRVILDLRRQVEELKRELRFRIE
jgi:DNA-binding transcriptional MerR regulator